MARAAEAGEPEDVGRLREQVYVLAQQVDALTQAISVTTGLEAIGKGLSDLVGEISPLRSLVPPTSASPLTEASGRALRDLREALRAPDWNQVQTLDVQRWDVGYIGQADPPRGRIDGDYQGASPAQQGEIVAIFTEEGRP